MSAPPSSGGPRRPQLPPGEPRPIEVRPIEVRPIEVGPGEAEVRGRGAAENPANRFERLVYAEDPEHAEATGSSEPSGSSRSSGSPGSLRRETWRLPTRFYRDPSRSILSHNDSPDVGFETSLNPYRGCQHGCAYCYARPTHEYLGLSAGLDFETHILVKPEAPALLRRELASPRWRPRVVAIGGVTDGYQPVEKRLQLTRRCLEVFAEFRNPVAIVTKSSLITRDVDLLAELAAHDAVHVQVSVTSLDDRLRRALEPQASSPRRRLETIAALARARIPVGVMVAPVIPGLTDTEIPAILAAAARAGARSAGTITLRLPHGLADLFDAWLERHVPERRRKVMNRILSLRGGRVNDPRFHTRMRGSGAYADQIAGLFELARRRARLDAPLPPLSTAGFRRPAEPQLSLF